MQATGEPYSYVAGDPVNSTDASGMCNFLVVCWNPIREPLRGLFSFAANWVGTTRAMLTSGNPLCAGLAALSIFLDVYTLGDAAGLIGAAGDLPPAVIGEGMESRVIPYAETHGYVYYEGLANPEDYTLDELLAHNRTQIETWIREGRPVIDVGPQPGRHFYPMATSPNYAMEQNILRGYPGYTTRTLPGEPRWNIP